jgi:predicted permease
LLRTVFALRHVPLGFRTDHVFVITPNLPQYKYSKQDANTLVYRPLLDRLEVLPGVQAGAVTTEAPLEENHGLIDLALVKAGSSGAAGGSSITSITATMRAAGPELQKVLGFGMARGRYFNAQDTAGAPLVAVVNHAFAQQYESSNGDISKFSLGMGTGPSDSGRKFKIVGIIDDLHQVDIGGAAMPEIDVNAAQVTQKDGFYPMTLGSHAELLLRSSRDPRDLLPEIRHTLVAFNPDLSGAEIRTMDQVVDDAMGSQLLAAHLLEALGGLALLVSLAGLYSLLAYLVALRTRELGLRLALGAQRSDLVTLILRGAGTLLVVGIAAGLAISIATAHLLHSFLYGVKDNDIATLALASLLLLSVGLLAAWLPARRAAALDPMQALRTE